MSLEHSISCDQCDSSCDAGYNDEYWLPPGDWAVLVNNEFKPLNYHLCPNCLAKLGKKK